MGVCIQELTMYSASVVYSMNIIRLMGAKCRPDDVQKLIYDYFVYPGLNTAVVLVV